MEDRVKKIVDTLFKGTKEKKIFWEPTEREKEYAVKLETGGVTIDNWTAYDDDSGDVHNLTDIAFLTNTGEVIDRVVFERDRDPIDYRELLKLHDMARRTHLKVDEKLDDILGEIQKKIGSTAPI